MACTRKAYAVLVTGAAGTLGSTVVAALAKHGFHVWAGVRDNAGKYPTIERATSQHATAIRAVRLDLTDQASIEEAFAEIERTDIPLFGVVSNAAITLRGYFEDLSEDEIRVLLDTNLLGTMAVVRRALPAMRRAGCGRIVNISSIGGRIGSPGLSAYIATKFAVEGFSESLYLELKPLGINVALVEPGIMRSNIWSRNRRIARAARSDTSLYRAWFERAEAAADRLVETATTTPDQVAETIAHILRSRNPRLRYVVGRRAALVLRLRRILPEALFERVYFGAVIRHITAGRPPHNTAD